jgi:hypothetical protein
MINYQKEKRGARRSAPMRARRGAAFLATLLILGVFLPTYGTLSAQRGATDIDCHVTPASDNMKYVNTHEWLEDEIYSDASESQETNAPSATNPSTARNMPAMWEQVPLWAKALAAAPLAVLSLLTILEIAIFIRKSCLDSSGRENKENSDN